MFNSYPVNSSLDKYEVDSAEFWNKIYLSDNPAWGKEPAEVLHKFKNFFTGNKILDIGCGEGRNSIFLSKLGYDVTGIDVSSVAIEKAITNNSSCNFLCKDLMHDSWPNETYDTIIDFGLFHFVPYEYRQKYVKNIFDHLNTNGIYCNQSGRLVKENPIIGKSYTPPQLEKSEIEEQFKDYNLILLEEDVLPKHNNFGEYPCWNLVVKK